MQEEENEKTGRNELTNNTSGSSHDYVNKLHDRSEDNAGAAAITGGMSKTMQNVRSSFKRSLKSKKALLGIGGGGIIGVLIISIIVGLLPYKLIALREQLVGKLDQRIEHMTNLRMGKIWTSVIDDTGTRVYSRTGHPLRDSIYNIASAHLVDKLKAGGMTIETDGNGKIIKMNGESINKLSDARSQIRQSLKTSFPEDSFLKRSLRAKKAYNRLGVPRRFFENTRAKADELQKDIIKRIRNKLVNGETVPLRGGRTISDPSVDAAATDAQKTKFDQQIQEAAAAEKAKFQSDLTYNPTDPPLTSSPQQLASDVTKEGITAAEGATNALRFATDACNAKNILHETIIGAQYFRAISEARYAGIILTAADQMKMGTTAKGNMNGDEVNAFMNNLGDIEQSPAFRHVLDSNSSAPITTQGKFAVHLTGSGGLGGALGTLDDRLNSIPGVDSGCKVATNVLFQIGATAATIGADFFTGGTFSMASASFNVAIAASFGIAEKILVPVAVQMLAGEAVTGSEPPQVRGDAVVAGYSVISNDSIRTNGGHTLSKAQVATLDSTIASETSADNNSKTLVAKLFDINYSNSFISRLASVMPSNVGQAFTLATINFANMNQFFVNLINFDHININGLLSIVPSAHADGLLSSQTQIEQAFSIDSQGMTDEELNRYDPKQNEEWMYANNKIDDFNSWVQKCLTPDTSSPDSVDAFNDPDCQSTDETHSRYRAYQLDKNLVGGLEFMSGAIAKLPSVDANDPTISTSTPAPANPTLSNGGSATGSSAQLASQLLNNPNFVLNPINTGVRYDLTTTSLGQPIQNSDSCGNAITIAPDLLQVIVTTTQKYRITVNNIVTNHLDNHQCDAYLHPKGRAFDVELAVDLATGTSTNFTDGSAGDSPTIDRAFVIYESSIFPSHGGGLGQADCPGRVGAPMPANVNFFTGDTCNHQHVDVR